MNTEQSPYQIIPIIHASGERLPCLAERASWLPLRLANRWAVDDDLETTDAELLISNSAEMEVRNGT